MEEEQKKAEETLKEEGWEIIHPTFIKDTSKCDHVWEKVADNDYQCKKCLKGYIGEIN